MSFLTFYDAAKNTIATGDASPVQDANDVYYVETRNLKTVDLNINRITTSAAVEIIQENGKFLETHPGHLQSMQKLVRAYDFLRTQEDRILHKDRSVPRTAYTHFFGSIKKYNNNIKAAENAMLNQFNTFLFAHKQVAKTSELESKLIDHIFDIECNLESLGVKKELWNSVKEHIIHGEFKKAESSWKKILDHVLKKAETNLQNRDDVENFLLGKKDFTKQLKNKGPQFAKFCARYDELEKISKQSPELRKLWIKAQASALMGNNKKLGNYIERFCKLSNSTEIYDYFFYKPAALPKNIIRYLSKGTFRTIWNNLSNESNKLFEQLKTYLRKQLKPDTSQLGPLNLQIVTLGNNNYLASAAPKNSKELEAYFDNLEKNETHIIVDLKGDLEKKMKNFSILPDVVGEEITISPQKENNTAPGTKIKLLEKKEITVEGSLGVQTLTALRIDVKRPDGKSQEYSVFKLNHWNEAAPPDPNILHSLSEHVNEANKERHGNNISVQCADGYTRTATFLMYHHCNNHHERTPLEVYVDYQRIRPSTPPLKSHATPAAEKAHNDLEKGQFAHLCDALINAKPKITFPKAKIIESLTFSKNVTFLKHVLEANLSLTHQIADNLHIPLRASDEAALDTANDVFSSYLSNLIDKFLNDISLSDRFDISANISVLDEAELQVLFFLIQQGFSASELAARASPQKFFALLNNENKQPLYDLFPEYRQRDFEDPLRSLVLQSKLTLDNQSNLHTLSELTYNTLKNAPLNATERRYLLEKHQLYQEEFKTELQSVGFDIEDYLSKNISFTPYYLLALPPHILASFSTNIFVEMGPDLAENLSEEQCQELSDAQILAIFNAAKSPENDFPYLKKLPTYLISRLPPQNLTREVISQLSPSQLLAFIQNNPASSHSDTLHQDIYLVLKKTHTDLLNETEVAAYRQALVILSELDKHKEIELSAIFFHLETCFKNIKNKQHNSTFLTPAEQGKLEEVLHSPLILSALNDNNNIIIRQLLNQPDSGLSKKEKAKFLKEFSTMQLGNDNYKKNYLGGFFKEDLVELRQRLKNIDWSHKSFSAKEITNLNVLLNQTSKMVRLFPFHKDYQLMHQILNEIMLHLKDSGWEKI